MFNDDDSLNFAADPQQDETNNALPYKVLIVDDEESVHKITKLVLSDMSFQGRKLQLFHAYSAKDGEQILSHEIGIAVILLDVVMETDSAGLDLVKIIRGKLQNHIVRIILRTGQAGQAPEAEVIVNYDINDYKNKSELTSEKLFLTLVTALRSYTDLVKIESNKIALEKVLASTSSIINMQSIDKFFGGLLEQVISLTHNETTVESGSLSVYMAFYQETKVIFDAGMGGFEDKRFRAESIKQKYQQKINLAVREKKNIKTQEYFILFQQNKDDSAMLMLFEGNIANLCIGDDLLNIFIKNIAITYDNLLLSNDIKENQKDTIFMLSEMAEQRSRETGKHVKRVAFFAKEIAQEMGLSEKEVEEVFASAPMHDIGKIAISDKILKKPGKLTADEFEQMKLHAQKGFDLFKNSEKRLMKLAAIVAHEHHERYDGKGYPRALQGDEIHVYARITALCDVFDALSSKRVYKDAWPVDKVLDLVKNERTKQFDPVVVDAFFKRQDRILEILEEHKDDISDDAFCFD